ncbi:MAG TPA: ABC transporter permease [Dehalococcoidia bacterium]
MTAIALPGAHAETLASALSRQTRPANASPLVATRVFAWRSVLKIKHVPEQLLDVLAIPVIFTLMFTYLFGGALSGSTGAYLQFLLPGTLVMTVLLLTMYTAVGLNTDITTGVTDRFRSLPIWQPAPIVGALAGDVARYLIASGLVLGLGFAIGFHAEGGATGIAAALALILAFAFSLSWIWTTLAVLVRSPNSIINLGMMVLFPLTLASNVFVDPKTTPAWLEAFIKVNPVSHLVTAARGLIDGNAATAEIVWVLVADLVIVVLFAPLTMWVYGRER